MQPDDFTEILEEIAGEQPPGAAAELQPSGVPLELRSPGEIVRRQTTYWELEPTSGELWRVRFVGKEELAFAEAGYPTAEVLADHPLLAVYDEPTRSLYFNGVSINPGDLAERVAAAIHQATGGWRGLDADAVDQLQRQLAGGYGLLMNGARAGLPCRRVRA